MVITAGARIGSYEVLSPLGAGGKAEVYRAHDTRLSEAHAAPALDYPNILTTQAALGPFLRDRLRRFVRSGICWLTLLASVAAANAPRVRQPVNTSVAAAGQGDGARVLEPGKPIERELAGGESHSYRLMLAAGQFCHVIVDQRGIDVVVELFGPDGKKIVEVDSPNGREGPEPVSLVAEIAASYRLEVRSLERNAPAGRYAVKIEELRTATAQDKVRIDAERAFAEGIQLENQQTAETQRWAIEKYQESLTLWQSLGDTVKEVTTLSSIGRSYINLGENQKSLDFYERALSLSRAMGDSKDEAAMLDRIATVYDSLGQKQKALGFYNQALQLRRVARDPDAEAASLNNIGLAYANLGESQKALDFFNQALPIYRTLSNQRAEATTLNNIGLTYGNLGEYHKALDFFNQALPIHRAVNNRQMEATTFNNMGVVTRRSGEMQKALDYFSQALPIYKSLGNLRDQGMTLANIGLTYNELGEYHKALDFFNQALPIHRSAGNRRGEVITLSNTGLAHANLGERQRAIDHYSQALQLSQTIGERHGEAATLYYMARLERDRGNLVDARNRIEESLAAVESLRADVTSQQLRASYFASVRKYHDFYIDLLMGLHKQRPSEGFDAIALEASEKSRARSLLELLKEARAEIQLGVDPVLIERERTLRQMMSDRAERQMRLLSGKHTEEQAAAAAKEINTLTTEYDQLQARIRQTSPRYAALTQPAPLSPKEIQKQVLDDETLLLEYALGEEKSFLWAMTPTSIISFELPKRAEIETAARRVYELVTARNQFTSKETPEHRRLRVESADAEYPKASAALSQMLLGPVASQLETKRLLIVSEGMLQYVPFAALPVPETERSREGEKERGRDRETERGKSGGRKVKSPRLSVSPSLRLSVSHTPLVVDHEIVSLPSASVLAALRRETAGRGSAAKTVAVLADPVFYNDDPRIRTLGGGRSEKSPLPAEVERSAAESGLEDFVRLRFSRQEAEQIVRLAPEGKKLKALDFAASRAAATSEELGQFRIVHFATHGLINSQHPELSGIVLSLVDEQGRPQNGFLRLYDIYNLKLGADLVVLSACQTALGKEVKGEGLVGLTRGFMYAGAPRVAASLWRIDDRATAELMKRFYQRMLGEGMPAASALRAAQVSMWREKRWEAPHYWAAFTLQGEWK
ncbi:MAG: CHAT domain-containing protein [Blastocatellia bacterium]